MGDDLTSSSAESLDSTLGNKHTTSHTLMDVTLHPSSMNLPEIILGVVRNLSTNGSSGKVASPLPSLLQDEAILNVPLVVFLALVLTACLLENSVVLYVYVFRLKFSIFNQFVIALSVIDILTCLVVVPIDLINVIGSLQLNLCKPMNFTATMLSTGTGLLLVEIAVVRFLAVHRPLKPTLRPLVARLLVPLSLVGGGILAWPSAILEDSATSRLIVGEAPGAWMKICRTDNAEASSAQAYKRVYHYFLFAVFCVTCAVLFGLYAVIGRILVRRSRSQTIPTPKPLTNRPEVALKRLDRSDKQDKLRPDCLHEFVSSISQNKFLFDVAVYSKTNLGSSRKRIASSRRRSHGSMFLRGSVRPTSSLRVEFDPLSDDPFSDEIFLDFAEDSGMGTSLNSPSISETSSTDSTFECVLPERSIEPESDTDQETCSLLSDTFDDNESEAEKSTGSANGESELSYSLGDDGTTATTDFSWCSASCEASCESTRDHSGQDAPVMQTRPTSAPSKPSRLSASTGLGKSPSEPTLTRRELPPLSVLEQTEGDETDLCHPCEDEIPRSSDRRSIYIDQIHSTDRISRADAGVAVTNVNVPASRELGEHGGTLSSQRYRKRRSGRQSQTERKVSDKGQPYRMSISPLKCNRKRVSSAFRVYRVMLLLAIAFVGSYVPFLVAKGYDLLFSTGEYTYADQVFQSLAYRSFYLNALANPFIYGCQCINFRKELKSAFRKLLGTTQ